MDDPNGYDPDLIQTVIQNLTRIGTDLSNEETLRVQGSQTAGKWGFQPQPIKFQRTYSDELDELHGRISKAVDNLKALQQSLTDIKQDILDADVSSAELARRIAASRTAAAAAADSGSDSGYGPSPSSVHYSY